MGKVREHTVLREEQTDWPASQLYRTLTWLGRGAPLCRLWPRFRGSQATLFTDSSRPPKVRWLAGGNPANFGAFSHP